MKSTFTYRIAALTVALLASVSLSHAEQAATASPVESSTPDSTVVGKVTPEGGKVISITRSQVKDKLKLLPPQFQNAPFKDIFPLLLKSVLTEEIVKYHAEKANIRNTPEYLKMVEAAKDGVEQKCFLDKEVEKKMTDAELLKAYEEVKKAAPKEDEFNISMITVTDKKKADSLLKDLKKSGTANFAEIANKESMNKISDGNLGYVRLGDLPDAFRDKVKDAAKATLVPTVVEVSMPESPDSAKKVMTYNILFVQDKRQAQFPPFEAVKSELKTAVSQKFAKEVIKELEKTAKIEMFTIDGKPVEVPEDKKTDAKAPDAPAAKPAIAPAA